MRLYGEANDVQGLATGPIETRFARLRENTAADTLIVWTTPGRWATGEGLSLRFPQLALVKGDARSFTIAAASILAKVTRDRLMLEYDRRFPAYGFARHKGYGTTRHLAALAEHGPSPIHRRSFAPLKPAQAELF